MKKIKVVFTGGTIGSKVKDHAIDVDKSSAYLLLDEFRKLSRLDVVFETLQPLNILSENLVPSDWTILQEVILSIDSDDLDGIIITHGSDTLPYTSAALGYMFPDIDVPLLITASNKPIGVDGSNGVQNFKACVEFISKTTLTGVFTVFTDTEGCEKIYLPGRLKEADPYNDQFANFGGLDLGYLESGNLIMNGSIENIDAFRKEKHTSIVKPLCFTKDVFGIRPFPGLNYDYYDFSKGNKPVAIVHDLYHSGTACIKNGEVSLPEFIRKCRNLGIDFYLVSFKDAEDLYVTSKELLESGAIPLINLSFEAAIVKLWIAYNHSNEIEKSKEFMKKEAYFELA